MNSVCSPVIIIGMHRSGTALVTRMLEELGLFVGENKEGNAEAMFFLTINRWLMSQSGAAWDNPEPIKYLLANPEIRTSTRDYIVRFLLDSPRSISFLGWQKYLRYRSPFQLDRPWGWKDPLNTYTLPLWLDIFPNAKVIHVHRHGVDVAHSLLARQIRGKEQSFSQQLYYRLKPIHWIRPKTGGFIGGMRCATLEGGLSLWDEYLSRARSYVEELPGRTLEVKYEDLLSDPQSALKAFVPFCNLSPIEQQVDSAIKQVNKKRAYAYRQNQELKCFADRVAHTLLAHDYSA